MPKSPLKVWEEGDRVKLKTMYPGTNGKVGWVVRVGKFDYDVKIGNFTFLSHRDQMEEVDE